MFRTISRYVRAGISVIADVSDAFVREHFAVNFQHFFAHKIRNPRKKPVSDDVIEFSEFGGVHLHYVEPVKFDV